VTRRYLAFDFGAESGRAIVGTLHDGKLDLDILHRFPTEGISILGRRQWDVTRMYGEMLAALSLYARKYGPPLDAIGIDTWGVDFALIASDGTLLSNPTHYRDSGHQEAMQHAFSRIPREEIYQRTGIQFMPINTAWQLFSLARKNSPLLRVADKMLMMGDLFGYLLTGRAVCEYTNASTTQLLDCHTGMWDDELIRRLGLPRSIFPEIVQPGTTLGPLLPEIVQKTGIAPDTPVIAPATHDTGSAVVAVPALAKTVRSTGFSLGQRTDIRLPLNITDVPTQMNSGDWAYLSSGTWSLLGAEIPQPIVNDRSLALNFTNEGGFGGTIRLLKNIIGLWILQECRRTWQHDTGSEITYKSLMQEAAQAKPFVAIIDVDDPRLLAPANMCDTVQTLVREAGYNATLTRAQMVRIALESLALRYRRGIQELDSLTGRTTSVLHIIGGGCQNKLLCQMTADACAIPVLTGSVEATALGNILVQAIATGAIDSWSNGRKIVAGSFPTIRYDPA
jgi:rhamnulokinase